MSLVTPRTKGPIALVVASMLAIFSAVYAAPYAGAAPATVPNLEVTTRTLFDGTNISNPPAEGTCPADTDPVDGGGDGVGKHTPGEDCYALNGVVRSWDLTSVAVTWDVNEVDSKATKLVVTLRTQSNLADVRFAPDQTGMFTGCLPGSSITGDGLILTCELGDLKQGTHGVIRPQIRLNAGVDGTKFTLDATASDASGATPAVAKTLTYTVSSAPSGNWVKPSPVFTQSPVTVDGKKGYVVMFPISLRASAESATPLRGAGSISTDKDIVFYDHAWKVAEGATLATPAQIAAASQPVGSVAGTKIFGAPCGMYDAANKGALPVTQGTWTCSPQMASPTGYPVWKVTVSGYSAEAPAKNADGTPNANGVVIAGQIVLWLDADKVDADVAKAGGIVYQNSITSDPETVTETPPKPQVAPINIVGANVNRPETSVIDNTDAFAFGALTGDSGATIGGFYSHYGFIGQQRSYQYRTLEDGTVQKVPYTNLPPEAVDWWLGTGVASRGMPLTMNLFVGTAWPDQSRSGPIQGCMRWDPTQVFLTPMPDLTIQNFDTVTSSGTYTTRKASDTFGDLMYGTNQGSIYKASTSSAGIVDFSESVRNQLGIHVEYGYETGASTYSDKVAQNSVECNNAASRTWVDSKDTAGLAKRKLANGTYQFDMVRVRIVGEFPWATNKSPFQADGHTWYNGPFGTAGFYLAVSGRVGTDLKINPNGKSVYVHTSRAQGEWDPATTPKAVTEKCEPNIETNDVKLDRDPPSVTGTGWCNMAYDPAFENRDAKYTLDPNAWSYVEYGVLPMDGDTDRVTIVQARPAVEKSNDNGVMQIVDNGGLVHYTIKMSAIGSPYEALTGVKVTDTLPSTLQFVSLDKSPSTPGSFCTLPSKTEPGGQIVCTVSQPDPLKPIPAGQPGYGLPIALPGSEWSDEIKITVQVKGAVASAAVYRGVENAVTIESAGLTPWQNGQIPPGAGDPYPAPQNAASYADSYLPLASDKAAIVKSVDAGLGPCTAGPDGTPLTGDALKAWQERCSIIAIDPNPSAPTTTDKAGNMKFSLAYTNSGNSKLTNVRMVDVLPFNGDGTLEPPSNSAVNGAIPSTVGDARSPESKFHGKVGLVAVEGANTVWATKGDPSKISRDADAAINQATWCVQSPSNPAQWDYAAGPQGACPANAFDVTAVYLTMPDLLPTYSMTATITLDTEGSSCNDLWTNTFGLRTRTITLPIRSNDVSVMAGCQSVGDFVWLDINRDGLQDANEPPMANITVNLYDDTNNLVGSTKTDSSGYYTFQTLVPSRKYTIEFVAPKGSQFTKQNASGDASNSVTDNTDPALAGTDPAATKHGDSDADPATGKVTFTASAAIGKNQVSNPALATVADNPGIDAGIVTPPVSVGDYVWIDVNRNGQQDANEPPVPGVTVNLYGADGTTLIATTKTDTQGYYAFPNLFGGQKYVIEWIKPNGMTWTTPNVGSDVTDSDANQATGRVDITAPLTGKNETAPGKADNPTFDAGLVQLNLVLEKKLTTEGPFTPGQKVSFELLPKNEGPADAIPGWSVTDLLPVGLTFVSASGTGYTCKGGQDAIGDTVTCTAAAGLAAGATGAPITVMATIDQYVSAPLHNVAYVSPDSKEIPETNPLVVPKRDTDTDKTPTDNDAQAVLPLGPVSIGDYVWWDVNRDGLQEENENPVPGVVVTLYYADGVTKLAETTTNDKGFYSFTGLAPNSDYVLIFTKPDGTSFTTPLAGTNRAIDSNPDAKGYAPVHTPKSGNNSATTPDDPTFDAGLVMMNLTLTKTRTSPSETVQQGDTVTFALVPHNDGPTDALAGWSVTDLLPPQLGFVSASGDGYTCTSGVNPQGIYVTCVAAAPLLAGKDGPTINLVTKVAATEAAAIHNVAFVAPKDKDTPETNPLVPPNRDTDTDTSTTDNDAQAILTQTGTGPTNTGGPSAGLAVPLGVMFLVLAGGVLYFGRRRIGVTPS